MSLQNNMFEEREKKELFELARSLGYSYSDSIDQMDVFPSEENLKTLAYFDEELANKNGDPFEIINFLNQHGSKNTIAQTGGRYFGFVNGGALPISLAIKWLSDIWDQNGGLYLTSPLNAKLESVCEKWLIDLFDLPKKTVAGFVSGTSTANMCALAAARFQLLKNSGWDVNKKGLNGAPIIKIITHQHIHASIKKALAILGFGSDNIIQVESDDQGRMIPEKIPVLDSLSLVILQAGNVNTGAFDPFETICEKANQAGAWVHIDGAFGLWAQASKSLAYLTKGMEKASSWAVDGHKTLNTPYDSGIVMCRHPEALVSAMQAKAAYINYSGNRNPMLFTPEMSKRSRAIELWACIKYLGKDGIDEMVTGFHLRAKQLAEGLKAEGFNILNDIVFNQVLISCSNPQLTENTLQLIQKSGKCWCGGSIWKDEPVIRVSICSWATTQEDIRLTVKTFVNSYNLAKENQSIK